MNKLMMFLAALLLATAVHAEMIFLKDGRFMHVKVVEHDDIGLRVQRFDTGGILFVRWELLREDDRKRLRVEFGYEEDDSDADLRMAGHRVYVRKGDYYDGIIDPDQSDQERIVIRHDGKEFQFVRSSIRRIEEREISVFDVYTPEELYQQKLAELQPDDAYPESHFDMARWSTKVGMYGEALKHYTKFSELAPDEKVDYVANQKKRLEILDAQKEIRDAIKLAEKQGRRHRYAECLAYFDEVLAVPNLDQGLRSDVEAKKAKFERRRWKYYAEIVEKEYHRLVTKKINAMARSRDIRSKDDEKKLTIDKVMSYLRSEMHKEIVNDLARKHELDPKKEVEKMWEERKSRGKRTASYGAGTFIVEKGKTGAGRQNARTQRIQDLQRRFGGRNGRGGNQQGQGNQPKQPRLVTKDEWWEGVDSVRRSFWMRAYYAEKSGKMEVTNVVQRPCPHCGGTGTIKEVGNQGQVVRLTCPRSHGLKGDRVVTYR